MKRITLIKVKKEPFVIISNNVILNVLYQLPDYLLDNNIKTKKPINNKYMQYKVVPFNQSKNIANDLQKIINQENAEGWEYVNHNYHHYLKPGKDGCFGLGSKPDQIWHVGNVVFQKKD